MINSEIEALPSFDGMANAFVTLGALGSPAELHGMACGRLCGGARYSEQEWLKTALEFLDVASQPDPEAEQVISDLYRVSLDQLHDEHMGLQLMLPGDEVEMAQRVMALSHWCEGFLTGFGTSGVSADTTLSGDTADALRDFAAFVQISPDQEEEEEGEMDYLEIIEYVRLAVLSIFMEIGIAADDMLSGKPPTVH